MSCAFCTAAFCAEHHCDNVRLTEYYQLACLRHTDLVLCEDPNVLKIFGLGRAPKTGRKTPQHRKSGGGAKTPRTGSDDVVDPGSAVRPKRKFAAVESRPLERSNPKRSCRDYGVQRPEEGQTVPPEGQSAQPSKGDGDSDGKAERHPDRQRSPKKSETGRKRGSRSNREKDGKSGFSSPPPSSGRSEKGESGSGRLSGQEVRSRKQEEYSDCLKAGRRVSGDPLANYRIPHRSGGQDSGARRKGKLTAASSSDVLLSPAEDRSSSFSHRLFSADLSAPGSAHASSTARPAASKSCIGDEPLFDNSDDEFPDLVIDVPTV